MKKILFPSIVFLLIFYSLQNSNHKPLSDWGVEVESWAEKGWNLDCLFVPQSGGGALYTEDRGDCTYISRNGGESETISEEDKETIRNILQNSSDLLQGMDYKQPLLDNTLPQWPALLYKGICYCDGYGCCPGQSEQATFGLFSRRNPASSMGNNTLMIRVSNTDTSKITAAHELFHACAAQHLNNGEYSSQEGYPFYWISEGGAEAFAYFALRNMGNQIPYQAEREYDYSLFLKGDPNVPQGRLKDIAYGTAPFWDFVTKEQNDFSYMKPILEKDFASSGSNVGAGVEQVHDVLLSIGYEGGLAGMYLKFIQHEIDIEYYFKNTYKKKIRALEVQEFIELTDIQPMSTHLGKVLIVPDQIEVEDEESKKFTLTIELQGDNPDLHLFYRNQKFDEKIRLDVTRDFREKDSLNILFRVANTNVVPQDSRVQRQVKVIATLSELNCPMLPNGINKLVYKSTFEGDDQLKITYNLANNDLEEDMVDSMSLSIYSYQLEKHVASASLDLECQEEGVVFKGMETMGLVPATMRENTLDMTVATNTNLIPHRPIPGTNLPNAKVVVESTTINLGTLNDFDIGEFMGDINIGIVSNLTNRRVVKRETITVPAGTFECWRIEYDGKSVISIDGKLGFVLKMLERQLNKNSSSKVTLWVMENHGWVKQEVRSGDGTTILELIEIQR